MSNEEDTSGTIESGDDEGGANFEKAAALMPDLSDVGDGEIIELGDEEQKAAPNGGEKPKTEEPAPKEEEEKSPEWHAYRKKNKQLKNFEKELNGKLEIVSRGMEQIQKFQKMLETGDTEELLRHLKRDPDKEYTDWTRKKLQGGKPDPAETANQRLDRLEKELREEREQNHAAAQQRQQQESAAQQQQAVDFYVEQVESGEIIYDKGQSVKLEEKWPNLADMYPGVRKSRVAYAVKYAMAKTPDKSFEEILNTLDKMAEKENSHIEGRRKARAQGSLGDNQNPAGSNGQTGAKQPRTLRNADQAAPSGGGNHEMSPNERIARAASLLPDPAKLLE